MFTCFSTLSRIPKSVWVLGGVSILMDISSEMIHSLLPLFTATTMLLWNDNFQTLFWIALLLANPGTGILWETHGAASAFWAGTIICMVALCGMRLQR